MAPVQMPVDSGSGDIVLAPEKKSHKGVIIALVLAVLIVGGLFAAIFLMPKNGSNANVSEDAKLAFNRYANYLLYGEDSDKLLVGEYDENGIYLVYEIKNGQNDISLMMDDSDDEKNISVKASDFFANAEKLWGNFYEKINDDEVDLISVANEYSEDFELYKLIILSDDSVRVNLISQTNSDSTNVTKGQIEARYADFTKSTYELVKDYGEEAIEYYSLYEENKNQLNDAGCVINDDSVECENSSYNELANTVYKLLNNLITKEAEAKENVARECWVISNILNGVDENE